MVGGHVTVSFTVDVTHSKVQWFTVDVDISAEELAHHRRALDVPAGPAATPRRVPRWLARLFRKQWGDQSEWQAYGVKGRLREGEGEGEGVWMEEWMEVCIQSRPRRQGESHAGSLA